MTGQGQAPGEVPSGQRNGRQQDSTPEDAAAGPGVGLPAGESAEREVVALLEPREGLPPLIATAEGLEAATRRLAAGRGPVAVDAERASGFRYGHRAFLVQLRRQGAGTVLIDPVACPDLSGIDQALAGTEAVLHAASQDLPCLADLGYRPRELFDTELAGRLLGYPRVGLGTLVETVLGLGLEKSHSAADWSTRPLPEEWLRYAALDVEVLVELRDALAAQLAGQGKLEWARQEFAAALAAEPAAAPAGSLAPHLRDSPGPQPPRPGHRARAVARARQDRPRAGPVPLEGAGRHRDRRGGPLAALQPRAARGHPRLQRPRRSPAHGRVAPRHHPRAERGRERPAHRVRPGHRRAAARAPLAGS